MKTKIWLPWLGALLAMLFACEGDRATFSPQGQLAPDGRGRALRSSRNYDEALFDLAGRLPGFGGFFFDSTGRLVVWLTEPSQLDAAKAALREFLVETAGSRVLAAERESQVNTIRALEATYGFRDLYTWYLRINSAVFAVDGVTLGDVDERRNRIVIGVKDAVSMATVRSVVEGLGVPADAIIVEEFAPMVVDASLRGTVRPIVAGIEIESGAGNCTLGYNVAHRLGSGQLDTYWYFVTNSHCTSRIFEQSAGDTVGQPDPLPAVGQEVADPGLFTRAQDPRCPEGGLCRYSDAALLRYRTSSWTHAHVAWPAVGSTDFVSTRVVKGAGDPIVGMTVHKIGRTTGHTVGQVTGTCVDVPVADPPARTMLCQGLADYGSDPGDSGSPIVELAADGSLVERGIHWGRQIPGGPIRAFSISNEWNRELRQVLGGTLSAQAADGPPPSVIADGHTYLPPGLSCTWTATGFPGVPPYEYVWSGLLTGGGSSISGVVWQSGWLVVTLTDAGGRTSDYSLYITIDPNAPAPPDCRE